MVFDWGAFCAASCWLNKKLSGLKILFRRNDLLLFVMVIIFRAVFISLSWLLNVYDCSLLSVKQGSKGDELENRYWKTLWILQLWYIEQFVRACFKYVRAFLRRLNEGQWSENTDWTHLVLRLTFGCGKTCLNLNSNGIPYIVLWETCFLGLKVFWFGKWMLWRFLITYFCGLHFGAEQVCALDVICLLHLTLCVCSC